MNYENIKRHVSVTHMLFLSMSLPIMQIGVKTDFHALISPLLSRMASTHLVLWVMLGLPYTLWWDCQHEWLRPKSPCPSHTDTLLIHSYKEEKQWGGCQEAMGWLPSPCCASHPLPTRFLHAHFTSPPRASPSPMVLPWCLFPWSCALSCEYLGPVTKGCKRQTSASSSSSPGIALLAIKWWREGSLPRHNPQQLSPPLFLIPAE